MKHHLRCLAVALCGIVLTAGVAAQDQRASAANQSIPRFALVVGNSAYQGMTPLRNPANDAEDIAGALRGLGFSVTLLKDAAKMAFEDALVGFKQKLATDPRSEGIFYYAGHGVQSAGINYLIPVDAVVPEEAMLPYRAVSAEMAMDLMKSSGNAVNLVILDACRDNPFSWTRSASRGLTVISKQPAGSIVMYATAAGSTAADGSGRNGLFTTSLLAHLASPGIDIQEVLRRTGAEVQRLSGGKQNPAIYSQYFGAWQLSAAAAPTPVPTPVPAPLPTPAVAAVPKDAALVISLADGVKGAEVFINGERLGTAPAMIQKLQSGVPLALEVRSGYAVARLDVTLKPKEVREVTMRLEQAKGILFVESNEAAVDVFLDGVKLGSLGTGLFRDVPAGEHKLELRGKDSYFQTPVTIPGNETARVVAAVAGIGAILVEAGVDVTVGVSGNGLTRASVGGALIADLPVGSYNVKASGPGYVEANFRIAVIRGGVSRWTPYSVGTLTLALQPAKGNIVIDGRDYGEAPATLSLNPGTHSLVYSVPGYSEYRTEVTIVAGKTVRSAAVLKALASTSLTLPAAPFGATLTLGSAVRTIGADDTGALTFADVPAGVPISFSVAVPFSDSLAVEYAARTINFEAGSPKTLSLPTGTFSLPWLPDGYELFFMPAGTAPTEAAELKVPFETVSGSLRSPRLAAGAYTVAVRDAAVGDILFKLPVQIAGGKTVELPGYRAAVTSILQGYRQAAQQSLQARAGQSALGWTAFAIGAIGAGGAAAAYVLGGQARAAYLAAEATSDVSAARSRVALWSSVFVGSAAVGGVGFSLSPFFWLIGPNPATLQESIAKLDDGLRRLGE